MKSVWIFLLMLPLFCIGNEDDKIDSVPILAGNPEYSAPPAVRIEQDTAGVTGAGNTAPPAVQPKVKTEVPEESVKPFTRQVYRRKLPIGVKSLSDEQVSSRVVYNPDSEKAANQRPVFSRIQVSDNSEQLARWRASHPPVRNSLPRVTNFRPAYSFSFGSRCSGFRSICRWRSSTRTVKITYRCSGNTCTRTTVVRCRR